MSLSVNNNHNTLVQSLSTASIDQDKPLSLTQATADFRDSRIGGGHADDIIKAIGIAQTFGTQELSNLATGIGHAPMIGTQHSSIISAIVASPAFEKHVNELTDLTQAEKNTIQAALTILEDKTQDRNSLKTIGSQVLAAAANQKETEPTIDTTNIPAIFMKSADSLVNSFGNLLDQQNLHDFDRLANNDFELPFLDIRATTEARA
ncbi:MAG: hypothetical protein O2962_07605 [Cyanobacteria bacterium]|nr:hypothetical protein [Cyanobacteriota bacterium]